MRDLTGKGLAAAIIVSALSTIGAGPLRVDWAVAAETRCQLRDVIGVGDKLLDYRRRGNRCEGLFRKRVSTSVNMRVAGFHWGRLPVQAFNGLAAVKVRVLGVESAPGTLMLRATALRPEINYVMDTQSLAQDGRFEWDTHVLAAPAVALRAHELALMACTRECAPAAGTIYLPVRVQAPAADGEHLNVTLVSKLRLSGVTYELFDGARSVLKEVKSGPIASDRAIRLDIGTPPPGRYSLRIDGRADNGLAAPLRIELLVPAT